jgi:arabinofuranan 3-O-arabinosyltransferase
MIRDREPDAREEPPSADRRQRIQGYLALAVLAYLPPLMSEPGKVAADTKQYLYLDPSRLLGRAASMWDPNIGFGTVTHQNIGYLFPMGPYYWLMQAVRVPDWIAQRLWLGTIVFFAGLGVLYLMRTLGVKGAGVPVAALAYMFSPYSLDYAARISVLLMPWAALGWLIALTIKALRDDSWRYPAIFALVIQVIGGVNATALIFAGVGPVLWILYSWLSRQVTFRRALAVTMKIGVLTVVTSLWWVAGLWAQGHYGLDILKFTETVKAVSRTSTPNEVLRGLGYWFFYGQDNIGPWTEASVNYTQHFYVILAGYGLTTVALLGAAVTRWRHRVFFLLLTFVGVVIAVGAYPYTSPTPLGSVFKHWANSSAAGLALRSTGRAIPLVTLGLAILIGIGVNVVARRFTTPKNPKLGVVIAAVIIGLIIIDFPALLDGTYYGKNLERPENVPTYWTQAIDYMNSGSHSTRVLEAPGIDFAAYTWGNTVDPITPGLMDRPYVARELIPWGSPASQNLLDAIDEGIQEGTFDPSGFSALARKMGVGTVDLRYDMQYKRYGIIEPQRLQQDFTSIPGLKLAKTFGPRLSSKDSTGFMDESLLALPADAQQPPSVAVYNVDDPTPIVRTESTNAPLVIAGDGDGLVDASTIGLVGPDGIVLYSGSYAGDPAALRKAAGDNGVLLVTDTNRKEAERWSTVFDNNGYTEQAGEKPLIYDPSDARLDVFPTAGDDSSTVMDQQGVKSIQATAYGNPITYTPEVRASQAFDGDPSTSWNVAAFDVAIGNRIQLETKQPVTTDHIRLVQKQEGPQDRWITRVKLTFDGGHPIEAKLDRSSRLVTGQTVTFPKRSFSKLDIEIANTSDGNRILNSGAAAVGFSEIYVQDEHASEPIRDTDVVRLPTDLLSAEGSASATHPLVLVMTRQRVLPVPPRTDPEPSMAREFTLPTARSFAFTGTARVTPNAQADVIDHVLGLPTKAQGGVDVRAKEYLAGCLYCRAEQAIDNDPTTAWVTPFVGVRRQWANYQLDRPITFDHLNLKIVADQVHSRPTMLQLSVDGRIRDIKIPALKVHDQRDSVDSVTVHFPAMTGSRIEATIASIDPVGLRTTYHNANTLAPVAIAEFGIPGLSLPAQPAQLPGTCRSDLLKIDGKPVPIRITGSAAAAFAQQPLAVSLCDPRDPTAAPVLRLDAGTHTLDTKAGAVTAVQLDQLVIASAANGGAAPVRDGKVVGLTNATPGPKLAITHDGRTKMTVNVTGATSPFWLVLGESQNPGWKASVHGAGSLGGSQLVDGFANGWRIDPKGAQSLTVTLEWTPERTVLAAIAISVVGALLCLVLIALGFARARRRVVALEGAPDAGIDWLPTFAFPWIVPGAAPALRTQLLVAVLGGLLGTAVAGIGYGVIAALLLLLAFRIERARAALAIAPPLLVGLIGLYIASKQLHSHSPAVFEWPLFFSRAAAPAWLAIVLFAADALFEMARRERDPGS